MSKGRIVWSDEKGDLRKNKESETIDSADVCEAELLLLLRRLTTGKGRTIIEISGLPMSKGWCKKLAQLCKKKLGVGGSYKDQKIEVHGEKMTEVMDLLTQKKLKFKKIGG